MATVRFSDFIKPLPNLPHLELPEESAAALADIAGSLHGWLVDTGRALAHMERDTLLALAHESLAEAQRRGWLESDEQRALDDVFRSAKVPDDVSAQRTAIAHASRVLSDGSPFAVMVIRIARDSFERDYLRHGIPGEAASEVRPRAIAASFHVGAWVADTAAGSVAGIAAAATLAGAIAIGLTVGAVASAAVLV